MNRHFRFLAALLALFAFSAYLAEGVWAATCPPETEKPGVEEVGLVDGAEEECPLSAPHSSHLPASPDAPELPGSEAPRCPLGFASGGTSCVSLTLPAATGEPLLALPEGAILSISPRAVRDLLLASAFFRPPIA